MMTLTEWTEKNGTEVLFQGTTLDEATQTELLDWYQFRQVCDDDRFGVYFRRMIRATQWQYEQQLRLESVQWDPMVADYMERQVTTDDTDSGNNKVTRSGTSNVDNESQTVSEGNSDTDSSTHTTRESTTNDSRDTTTTRTNNTETTGHGSGLTGNTPDTALYPATGYPESLAWVYASGQKEQKQEETSTENGKDTVEDSGTSTTNEEDTSTGKVTTTDTGKVTTTANTTGTDSMTEEGTNNRTHSGDTRERYSGRHESPQDLMDRARNYIRRSNAFLWLVDQLNMCFYGIIDWEV